MFDGMTWLNEPVRGAAGSESLSVTSAPETDFWPPQGSSSLAISEIKEAAAMRSNPQTEHRHEAPNPTNSDTPNARSSVRAGSVEDVSSSSAVLSVAVCTQHSIAQCKHSAQHAGTAHWRRAGGIISL
jgi:hypothetical protein